MPLDMPNRSSDSATHHVDEHIKRPFPLLYELRRVVLLPLLLLVLAEISLERFLSPWAVDWIGNRCKGGDGLVLSRVLEELQLLEYFRQVRKVYPLE
jgi:hypothetical protein